MSTRWVYRRSDGLFLRGGFYEPQFDPVVEGVVEFTDDSHPDPVRERFDAALGKRPATQAEVDVILASEKDANALRIADDPLARAIARTAWEEIQKTSPRNGQTFRTWDEFRARVRELIRERLS